jgi:hypothetical protein
MTRSEFGEVLTEEETKLPWDPESISSYVESKRKYFPDFTGEPERLVHNGVVAWYVCIDLDGEQE